MSSSAFISYAINREDIPLWRVFSAIESGRFVEIYDQIPEKRAGRSFEEVGWHGTTCTAADANQKLPTGQEADLHFAVIHAGKDTEAVLRLMNLSARRPWVVIVSNAEHSRSGWESALTEAGYRPGLFDGVNRFYIIEDKWDTVGPCLSYPACTRDRVPTIEECDTAARIESLEQEMLYWRANAVNRWATLLADRAGNQADDLKSIQLRRQRDAALREIDAIRRSVSWRVTRPIRAIRRMQLGRDAG